MTPGWLMDAGLAGSVVGTALFVVLARRMRSASVGFVVLGLLLAIVWVRLGAVDVAVIQVALTTGATGALWLAALARLHGAAARIEAETVSAPLRLLAGLLAAAVGIALGAAVVLLPDPAPSLAPAVSRNLPALGIGNPVAGALVGFRALDALLACATLVLALLAVWSFAPDRFWGGIPGPLQPARRGGPLLLARVLAPVALIVGVGMAWISADAPGVALQGGAVLATGLIILWLAGLIRPPPVARRWLRLLVVAGPLVFVGVGLAGLVFADGFLAYPPTVARPLITLIEAAMMLSCAAIIALLVAGPPERVG
jgi:multisubunit Na+/H+ antiporter MnhB subunit